jgi:uncharacterized SAM-binding protein YcdF (DUF218 family)
MKLRLDIRDKKPDLYGLLIFSAAVMLAEALVIWKGGEHKHLITCIMTAVYSLIAVIVLLATWKAQIEYNLYSYNTIFYFGFALFGLSVLITHVTLAVMMIRFPDTYRRTEAAWQLLGSAKTYMIYTSPFILIFSVALCISNVSLIRHEGRRFVNILGIILSFLMVGGIVLLFTIDMYASGSQREVMMHDLWVNTFAAVYLYFECMLAGVIVAGAMAARYDPEKNKDYVVILGCSMRKDGTPTPLLKGRIDRAVEFYEKQKAETGKPLYFVCSGGQGPSEVISESACMKNYLLSRGIPEDMIIEENRSTNTFENMSFSKEIIESRQKDAKIAFSTTNYHVFRSGLFARRVKMRAVGMGARTKWYFWPNAAVREFVGLLTNHKLKQVIILGSMIVFYVALTLISYNYY